MKKLFVLTLIAVLLLAAGCSVKKEETVKEPDAAETPETTFDPVTYLQGLPERLSEEDEIPVCIYCELRNPEKWDEFVEETEQGKDSSVTFANITIEGDPIYTYLTFDGDRYQALTDTSHDKFGVPATYTNEGKYLYQIKVETEEETNGGSRPFEHHLAFLSDQVYDSDQAVYDAYHQGSTDLFYLWGFSKIKE